MGSGGDNSIISSNAAFASKSSAEKLVCHRSAARRRSTGAVRSRKMAPQIAGGGVSASTFNSSMNLNASKRLPVSLDRLRWPKVVARRPPFFQASLALLPGLQAIAKDVQQRSGIARMGH